MDTEPVKAIAAQISQDEFVVNWKFHLLSLLLIFVASGLGSLATSYFKSRGKHLATKADFDSLLTQLKTTTSVAEKIKAEVSREDWTLREIKTLRRLKLEELMIAVLDTQNWLEKERSYVLYGGATNTEREPATRAKLISALYFPEMQQEIGAFYAAFLAYSTWMIEHKGRLLQVQSNVEQHRRVLAEAGASFPAVYQPLLTTSRALEVKAREVMSDIFGVAL